MRILLGILSLIFSSRFISSSKNIIKGVKRKMAKNLFVVLAVVSVAVLICSVAAEPCKYANNGEGDCDVKNQSNSGCNALTPIIHGCKKVDSPEYCCCVKSGSERCEKLKEASSTTSAPTTAAE